MDGDRQTEGRTDGQATPVMRPHNSRVAVEKMLKIGEYLTAIMSYGIQLVDFLLLDCFYAR